MLYCQQAPSLHPLHLWAVRTTTAGIQIPWHTLLLQTFQHLTVPDGEPEEQVEERITVWGGIQCDV